jgi:hypothetical protein
MGLRIASPAHLTVRMVRPMIFGAGVLLMLIGGYALLLAHPAGARSSPATSLAASVAISPDGQLLASGGWSGGGHGTIKIWDLARRLDPPDDAL